MNAFFDSTIREIGFVLFVLFALFTLFVNFLFVVATGV